MPSSGTTTLSLAEKARLRVKSTEFMLPLALEKWAQKMYPQLWAGPWLPGEREQGMIFTHVPKSAGTSIVQALFGQKSRHVPIFRYAAYDETRFRECFKFTFVRNPWSRIHSAYHYLHRRVGAGDRFLDWKWASHYLADTPTFEHFVLRLRNRRFCRSVKRYIHFRDQLDWISIPGRGKVMDFVGYFESLERDFPVVCQQMGLEQVPELPRLRPGRGTDYVEAYTDAMVDIVGHMYDKDISTFGYEFGE